MLWQRSPPTPHHRCISSGCWFPSSTVIPILYLDEHVLYHSTVTLEVSASHRCMYTASKSRDPPHFRRSPHPEYGAVPRADPRLGSWDSKITRFSGCGGWMGLKRVSITWILLRVQQARGGGNNTIVRIGERYAEKWTDNTPRHGVMGTVSDARFLSQSTGEINEQVNGRWVAIIRRRIAEKRRKFEQGGIEHQLPLRRTLLFAPQPRPRCNSLMVIGRRGDRSCRKAEC